MFRFLLAGVVAAIVQLLAVGLVSVLVVLSAWKGSIAPIGGSIDPMHLSQSVSVSAFLMWVYLLTALGAALTASRIVDFTALRIRLASGLMNPAEPEHASRTLLVYFCFAAVAFAALALRPPAFVIDVGLHFDCEDAVSIAWSAAMSIGMASFGANARAAAKAV